MPHSYLGEAAALGTAFCWTCSALCFTASAKRIGSLALNQIRLAQAFLFLMLFGWAWRGLALPSDASREQWLWLGLSGLAGFTFGDLCLFRAFVEVGPRISTLAMSLAPPIAALTGWLILGEVLNGWAWLGMGLTVAGIAWVALERPASAEEHDRRRLTRGLLLAFGGAVGQGVGAVLGKMGAIEYDPFAATQIRILAGMAGFAALFVALRWWPKVFEGLRHPSAMAYSALGAFFGPFLGVSLFMLSLKHVGTGITSTIAATVPVLIIPFVILVQKEKVSPRAICGAVLAVAGVSILFFGKGDPPPVQPERAFKASRTTSK